MRAPGRLGDFAEFIVKDDPLRRFQIDARHELNDFLLTKDPAVMADPAVIVMAIAPFFFPEQVLYLKCLSNLESPAEHPSKLFAIFGRGAALIVGW